MKTITLFLIVFSLTIVNAFAQKIEVQAGFSSTSARYKSEDKDRFDDPVFNPGFQIGATSEFYLQQNISLVPGVLIQTKGFHVSGSKLPDFDYWWEYDYNIWYLDIPLLLRIKIPVNKFDLFVDAGPYMGIGLSGKYEYKNVYQGFTDVEKGNFIWYSDEEGPEKLKRFEYGLMTRVGAKIKNLKVGLSYELSLRNIAVYDNYDYKNRVLTLFVSYPVFCKKNDEIRD